MSEQERAEVDKMEKQVRQLELLVVRSRAELNGAERTIESMKKIIREMKDDLSS